MNLRRISYLVEKAHSSGVKTHIFVRRCQVEALKEVRPAEAFQLSAFEDSESQSAFSFPTFLVEPPIEPYVMAGGGYVRDDIVQVCRDARRGKRKNSKSDLTIRESLC
jgi:hypothetical protein